VAREVVYSDDLTGEHGAEPVRIGWNDVWFEVDLAEANRTKLTEFIEPYINAGRPAGREEAPPRTRAPRGTAAPKRTLAVEDYGFPRRGRVSAEEAEYVREHLDEVNARLKAAGVREIDPSDEKLKERYGLGESDQSTPESLLSDVRSGVTPLRSSGKHSSSQETEPTQ
jgi:hypothetical protein